MDNQDTGGAVPQPFPDLSSTPQTPQAAQVALETLRMDRLAGRVDERRYVDRVDYLHRVIGGEKIAAVDPHSITMEQRLQDQYDEHMRAPDMARYQLPHMGGDESTAHEIDKAFRTAFAAAQIPNHLAGPIVEGLMKTGRALRGADAATRKMHAQSVHSKLRQDWGEEFAQRLEGVEDLLDDMAEADPTMARIVDRRAWMFAADLAVISHLDTVARHRRSKAATR